MITAGRRGAGVVVTAGLLMAAVTGCGGDGDSSRTHGGGVVTSTTARPPARVRVFVLNGLGLQGAAAATADRLRGLGYAIAGIGNAPHQQGNVVACRKGFVVESAQLATAVGPTATVIAFPSPEPTGVKNADCMVGLGT